MIDSIKSEILRIKRDYPEHTSEDVLNLITDIAIEILVICERGENKSEVNASQKKDASGMS